MAQPTRLPILRRPPAAISLTLLLGMLACVPEAPGDSGLQVELLPVSFLDEGGMPHLSPTEDGALLSWLERSDDQYALRVAHFGPEGFGEPGTVTRRDDLFVNWADFPSAVEVEPGHWVAHWLQRGDAGGYDYGVRIATSRDAGESWSEPWTPHEDGTPTEHGFVSIWPDGTGGWSLVWLDGRQYAEGPHGAPTDEMTIRSRHVSASGAPDPERLVDPRTCDCCQTDVAVTSRGPVMVYRDRSADEVRDIYLSRRTAEGWTEGHPVHDDGWVIAACPVNGPAADARGEELVVAWFTMAQDTARVRVAFSGDAGDTFSQPLRVDQGSPVGRTDVVLLADGSALVVWLEAVEDGEGEVRLRRVRRDGSQGEVHTLVRTSAARAAGFPQFVPLPEGGFLSAWTEPGEDGASAVRLARVTLP